MTWQRRFGRKLCTAYDAVYDCLRKGCKDFYFPGVCGVAYDPADALAQYSKGFGGIVIHCANPADSLRFKPVIDACRKGQLGIRSHFLSHDIRDLLDRTKEENKKADADLVPCNLVGVPALYSRCGMNVPDAVVIRVSPPDKLGRFSCGTETGLAISPARTAKVLIGQVDECMPFIKGNTLIRGSRFDYLVDSSYPIATLPATVIDPIVTKIGQNTVDFIGRHVHGVPTLQFGLGDIPHAISQALFDENSTIGKASVHAELFDDVVMDLFARGMIVGTIRAGLVVGMSQDLYRWVDRNPRVRLYPTEWVNRQSTIDTIRNMVAINGAITVDWTGQVNADSIGRRFYSGSGGQLDFMYSSSLAPGGLSIIALRSTGKKGGRVVSSIVSDLESGSGVVTTRYCGIIVITEHGVADLRGKCMNKRIESLTAIADPLFKDELEREARNRGYIE